MVKTWFACAANPLEIGFASLPATSSRTATVGATRQAKVKRHWDRGEQTRKSGIDHLPAQFSWLGLLINPCTFLPLNWMARLFNKTDLSEGYIVVADKPDQHEKAKPTPAQVSTP